MTVSARKVGLYGTVGFLVAALIIVGVVISSVEIPSLRPPTFIPDTGTLIIKITDAPVELDQLNITVDRVSVHGVEGYARIDLAFVEEKSEVTFDLLKLENVTMNLCVTEVPPGNYTMIEMRIIEAKAVYASGDADEPVPLNVPSNAVRVIVHFEVQKDEERTVLIEMEPDWVAISKSNNLRPVLKATIIS